MHTLMCPCTAVYGCSAVQKFEKPKMKYQDMCQVIHITNDLSYMDAIHGKMRKNISEGTSLLQFSDWSLFLRFSLFKGGAFFFNLTNLQSNQDFRLILRSYKNKKTFL